MRKEILEYYSVLRQLFVLCPSCGTLHRLSECKLFQKYKPDSDWKDKLDGELARLERAEEAILQKIEEGREASRVLGRRAANKRVRQIDQIFAPLKLNCDDSKVIFHPIDFVVFHGMKDPKSCAITEIILLDKAKKTGEALTVQKSVEKAVRRGQYEWMTLRVKEDGAIQAE